VAKFLEEGHKVKITIMFRGREVFHPELGKKILDRIAEQMDGMGKSEAVPRLDGRNMVMVLAPDKRAKQSAASKGPATEAGTNGSTPAAGAAGVGPVVAEAAVATAPETAGGTGTASTTEDGTGTVGTDGPAPTASAQPAPGPAGESSLPAESSEGEGSHDAQDEN